MATYMIVDTDGKVAGDRFIACPPAVQEHINLRLFKGQTVTIEGVETKVFPIGYANHTMGCDVAYLEGDNVTVLKR